MSYSIELENLSKKFYTNNFPWNISSSTQALCNINMQVAPGQPLALIGPNGAGKTTLLKVLATLIMPDSGLAKVNSYCLGKDDQKIRSSIGLVIPEERSFYWRLTGRENLMLFASLFNMEKEAAIARIEELFTLFRVNYSDKRFDFYSTGMKRKFALMRAILHDPDILFLDEPTKSLDRNSCEEIQAFIKTEISKEKTVVLATHNFDEAQDLCKVFAVLNNGELVAFGTKDELREKVNSSSTDLNDIYKELIRK